MRQPGRTDLEQKASFATEGVQRYDESSANGGSKKKSEWNEEKRKLFNLGKGKFAQKNGRGAEQSLSTSNFFIFLAVMPKCDSPLLSTKTYIANRTEYGGHYKNKQDHEAK